MGGPPPGAPAMPKSPMGGPGGPGASPMLSPGGGAGNKAAAMQSVKAALSALTIASMAFEPGSNAIEAMVSAESAALTDCIAAALLPAPPPGDSIGDAPGPPGPPIGDFGIAGAPGGGPPIGAGP